MTARNLGWAGCVAVISLVVGLTSAQAGTIFGNSGLVGGARWDAAPRLLNGNERSLDGGIRYSAQGGSYQAFRDQFSWFGSTPSVADFQEAVEDSFNVWSAVDPNTGLTSDLSFVADFATPVNSAVVSGVRLGAEIDLFATNLGDSGTRGFTWFNWWGSAVTLTSGTPNYPGSRTISGADVTINSNGGAQYTLDLFRRLLTHELGHAIGLGDVENADDSPLFIDDNYDPTNPATALATLTNSWAALVNPLDPAASPLALYTVADADPGIDTPGVNILMESNGLGIAAGNPVSDPLPLRNDDFGTRQFLYPSLNLIPEPSTYCLLLTALLSLGVLRLRRRGRATQTFHS